ncbi:methyl-accepting chemotaxis protein [Desulfobotulus sp.]|uniref:methyl-accepting chemotaxis protein n=1 Tax=Desulfobotulus sp. TaxID=1940337 RepID=UPI002A360574|nr:methyl-accepting chemotaxis protein [Desulfobotulus sp.]MDY0162018.1 methyl-accepting chemotaxis protein [Desulfobotulus sp.]
MAKPVNAFWGFFISEPLAGDPEKRRIGTFLVFLSFFAQILFLMTALRWFRMGENVLAINILVVMVVVLAAPFLLRITESTKIVAAYLMTAFCWYFFFYIWRTGGIASSAVNWLLIFPMQAAVFQGLRACVIWSVVMGLSLVFFQYGPEAGVVFHHLNLDAKEASAMRFGDLMRQLAAVAVCMYVIERVRLQAMAAQQEAYTEQQAAVREQERAATALARQMDTLQHVFERTTQNACDLLGASRSLASASTDMGEKVSKTALFSREVRENTEEIQEILHIMASSVEETSVSIREVRDRVNEGAGVARKAVQEAENASTMILKLSESSERIGRVTAVIQEISEQTNLLALNATIEAARAGESGKGFAVVAGEIKELSRKTHAATEEIRSHIAGNEATVVEVVENNRRISRIIDTIREGEESIAAAVEEQSVVIQEVAERIAESAHRSDAVSENVKSLNEAVEQIREGIEKMVASAAFLEGLAKDLNDTCEVRP